MSSSPHAVLDSPAQHEIQPPVYFAGGLGYDAARNEVVLGYIAGQGYETVHALANPEFRTADTGFLMTINGVSREVSRRQAIRLASKPEVETSISNFQQTRANELVESLERESVVPVNAIFQSADAQNGLLAASQHPELFRNIVLAYPAGIVRQPNPFKAMPRTVLGAAKSRRLLHRATHEADDFEDPLIREHAKGFGGFVVASSVALSQQIKILHEMRQRDNAPGVSLVLGLDDAMISPSRVLASLEAPDDVDFILMTDTPHGVNGRGYVMKEMLDLFQEMEELREWRQAGDPSVKHLADRLIFPKCMSPLREALMEQRARAVEHRAAVR